MFLFSKFGWPSREKLSDHATQPVAPPPLKPTVEAALGTTSLMVSCPSPTTEDMARDLHRMRGQFLARQDRWDDLGTEILAADASRAATPSGMPVADLLSYGARSDVVAAAEHALLDGKPPKDARLLEGIEDLEILLSEASQPAVLAVIVAQAHMDIGWAWRGTDWPSQIPRRNRDAFEAHFDRARDILEAFEDRRANSPFFASAWCTLLAGNARSDARIAREYERLIDLDPLNSGPMRALGNYLSPRWYGSHRELELEARRTAARTQAIWGAGAYTWVMFDALAGDAEACAHLDTEFFIEGLNDILTRRADQHTTNLLAAFCARTIGGYRTGHPSADATRARIANCTHWIVRQHLTEVHPMVWAHAAAGFDNNLRVPSPRRFAAQGQKNALDVIATLFRGDIEKGHRIVFTAEGPVAEPC